MIERLAGIRRKRQEEDTEYEPERLPIRRCIPDYHMGLYEEEILEREEGGWTNLPVDPPSKTTKEIIHDNIFTYFNLIFCDSWSASDPCGRVSGSDIFAGDHFEYIDRYRPGGPGKECTGQDDDVACSEGDGSP